MFTTDNRRMISLADDGTMLLWDVKTGGKVLVLEDNIAGNGLAFSADGWRLAAVGGNYVRLWDTAMIAGKCDPPSAQFYVARRAIATAASSGMPPSRMPPTPLISAEGRWHLVGSRRDEAELGKFADAAADYRALLARKPARDTEIFERLCHTNVAGAGIGPENRKAYFADADKIVAIAKARPIPGNVNDAAWITFLPTRPSISKIPSRSPKRPSSKPEGIRPAQHLRHPALSHRRFSRRHSDHARSHRSPACRSQASQRL